MFVLLPHLVRLYKNARNFGMQAKFIAPADTAYLSLDYVTLSRVVFKVMQLIFFFSTLYRTGVIEPRSIYACQDWISTHTREFKIINNSKFCKVLFNKVMYNMNILKIIKFVFNFSLIFS